MDGNGQRGRERIVREMHSSVKTDPALSAGPTPDEWSKPGTFFKTKRVMPETEFVVLHADLVVEDPESDLISHHGYSAVEYSVQKVEGQGVSGEPRRLRVHFRDRKSRI